MDNGNPKVNASGCKDYTAYTAIKNITREDNMRDKAVSELINVIKYLVRGMGFEIIGRIAIKDKTTGKEYR